MAGRAGRTLTVYLAADTKSAERDLEGFGTKLVGSLGKMAAAAGVAAAAIAVKLGVDAVQAASDFQETVAKSGVVFDDAAADVKAFAADADTALGLSEQAAIDAATGFGVFGKAAGLSGSDLAGFSTELTTLAADMASFNNADISETIAAIGAGLRGEAEPLRKYGVLLDDATLKAEALAMGIYDGTGALTAQNRVLAAQSVILKQTTDQQGDFARTSDGLANQQRILTAAAQNASVVIGTALLKSVLDVNRAMGGAQGMAGIIEDSADATADLTRGVGLAAAALAGLVGKADKSESALSNWIGTVLDAGEDLFPFIKSVRFGANALLGIGEAANEADAALASHQNALRATAARYEGLARAALEAQAAVARSAVASRYTALAVQEYGQSVSFTGGNLLEWKAAQDAVTESVAGSGGGGGGGTAGAVDEVSKAMLRQNEITERHIAKLDAQMTKLDEAKAKWQAYADSVSGALSSGVDVKQYYEDWKAAVAAGQDVGTLAEYLNRQLQANVDWAQQLATIPGLDPSSPGAQALIQSMAGLGAASGPAFITAFGDASYNDLATMLTNQQNAASGTGALFADYFYGAGVDSAAAMVTAMAEKIEKDEKKLRRIGERMGEPIGEGIKAAIVAALNEALARVAASTSTGGSGKSTSTYADAPITVNVTTGIGDPIAIARQIERTLATARLRTGRPL